MAKATDRVRQVLGSLRGALGEVPDAELLARFVAGQDEAAFAQLVRAHGPMVLGVCRRVLRHAQDAEDAFQVTFLVLARKGLTVARGDALGGWLYRVAYRTAQEARALRARRRAKEIHADPFPHPQVPAAGPDDWLSVLDQELCRLPAKYRSALVLCDLEARSRREAARRLGIPEGTLSSRLSHGRKLLAARLGRRGVTLGAGVLTGALTAGVTFAHVAWPLVSTTVNAAVTIAAGQPAAVSTPVALLLNGVLKAMFVSRCKRFTSFAALAVLSLGIGVAALQSLVGQAVRAEGAAASAGARPPGEPQGKAGEAGRAAPGEARPGGKLPKARYLPLPAGISVGGIGLAPDGKVLVTAEEIQDNAGGQSRFVGCALRVRDARTGEVRKTLGTTAGELDYLKDAAFSPDGKSLAAICRAGGETAVHVWDAATWEQTKALTADGLSLLARVAWSPDGRLLAAAGTRMPLSSGQIAVWDARTDKLLWYEEVGGSYDIFGLAFSPDGKLLASPSRDGTIKLWDARNGKAGKTLKGDGGVCSVAFSRDGLLASGGFDGTVRLWDLEAGKPKQTLKGGYATSYLVSVAFSPDGRTLAAAGPEADRCSISLFDARTGKLLKTFHEKRGFPMNLAFSTDGRTIAVGGWDAKESPLFLLPVDGITGR
jgi:RNA polymerase sigma factor (sigma-70 family)